MKASCRSQAIFLIVLSAYPVVMGVNSVQKKPSSGKVNPLTMQKELIVALHHSLHTLGTAGLDIEDIGSQLWDSFTALPKHNGQDLNSSTMRYLAHSFFIKQFGWLIRGLDPNRKATLRTGNATLRKNGKISNMTIPVNRNDIPGFLLQHWGRWFNSADDSIGMTAAVGFVALLGNLILHESEARLENSYTLNGFKTASNLPERDLEAIIDSFMILFSFEEDNTRNKASHRADKEKIHQKWAKFPELQYLSGDAVRNMAWTKQSTHNPFGQGTYSFAEASAVMNNVVQQYGRARDVQCHQLKDGLVQMDARKSGRVLLKHFYGKRTIGSWMLSESPQYLRQLGVLDESIPSLGPQVIIPNYVTSVSNCDSPSEYFSVCCIHECEDLLQTLERHIQAPTASSEVILELTANMSSETVEAPRKLDPTLVEALEQVAAVHGGEVPLHSRLFAQWLHYAFPHECPYPHLAGKINPLSPSEWFKEHGRGTDVSLAEVAQAMKIEVNETLLGSGVNMSQWTLDEEMRTDYSPSADEEDQKKQSESEQASKAFALALQAMRVLIFAAVPMSLVKVLVSQGRALCPKTKKDVE